MIRHLKLILLVMWMCPIALSGQVRLGGLLDLTHQVGDNLEAFNTNFRGDSPFHPVRAKIFLSHWASDHLGMFIQIWVDNNARASEGGQIRMEGAYVTLVDIGRPGLGFKVGKIPNTIGRFAARTYSDRNPLIGTPLMYGYRTALPKFSGGIYAPGALLITPGSNRGLPIAYDSCWDTGIEHFQQLGWFDYAAAITTGSLSDPLGAANNDGFQLLGRVGFQPHPAFSLGISGARGPYIGALPSGLEAHGSPDREDFQQKLWGLDFESSYGSVQLIGELVRNSWETFLSDADLGVTSWYLEGKWKFAPGWYLALRTDQMRFDRERVENVAGKARWDLNITRYEFGMGYHVTRNLLVKIVEQINHFPADTDRDTRTTVIQWSVAF